MLRIGKAECFLRIAQTLAKRSTCLDKQVGCIITNDKNEIIASGYNGAPRGYKHCIDTGFCLAEHFKSKNFCPSAHAEQNALLQCRVPEQIHTIYTTLSPCVTCIKMIMNTTCKRIIFIQKHAHEEARVIWHGEWIHYEFK
jgi:dCMP deaminase